jgi:benzylsuccinate CoA-transferase BbsE subunit
MKRQIGLLNPYRVLDLTDQKGFLCGKILADLGADVIKIEKPGGDPSRNFGPFYHDIPDPEKNVYWYAYNLNKRGITLNIESEDGKQIFKKLSRTADFVIESFTPSYLDNLELGYEALNKVNPRIIVTSITPFGHDEPYRNYKATDIVVMAMGGLMYITGTPDKPPLRISLPQAFLLASAHGAAASMVAHFYRETSGVGQHVDVSAQECVLWEIANAIPLYELNGNILKREGSFLSGRWTGTRQRLLWKCRDGYVLFYILGGAFGVKTNKAIVEWMEEKNMFPDYLVDFDWAVFDMANQTQEMQDLIESPIADLFMEYTKNELYDQAQKRGIMLCPVCNSKDILENEQLKSRDFWVEINHAELDTNITYPGVFAKLSQTPMVINRRAPLIGEHNNDIYQGELGLSPSELSTLHRCGVI